MRTFLVCLRYEHVTTLSGLVITTFVHDAVMAYSNGSFYLAFGFYYIWHSIIFYCHNWLLALTNFITNRKCSWLIKTFYVYIEMYSLVITKLRGHMNPEFPYRWSIVKRFIFLVDSNLLYSDTPVIIKHSWRNSDSECNNKAPCNQWGSRRRTSLHHL